MERSKKGNLQLSKTTLTSLSGGAYKFSWGKGLKGKGLKDKFGKKSYYDGEGIPGRGKAMPTGDLCEVVATWTG